MTSRIRGVKIAGIASAVPASSLDHLKTAERAGVSTEEAEKIAEMTGVYQRHVAPISCCTSDLANAAAQRLMADLNWAPESIGALVVVSQTHDYALPATACILQRRLALARSCAAFDVSLGCSGYVYGLWLCGGLLADGVRRVLLLAGDTMSRACSPQDRSTVFLFGDAGTATALERDPNAPNLTFVLGTDGSGEEFLIQPASGFRNRATPDSFNRLRTPEGSMRNSLDLFMDGTEVFRFTLREVPTMVAEVLSEAGWTLDDLEAFVPHQANQFMLRHLAKRLKVPSGKLALSLERFGNTSSASIPLTLSHCLNERLRRAPARLLLAGFGVGWSWGTAAVTLGPMVMPDVICLPESESSPAD